MSYQGCSPSLFAGMSRAQLMAALATLQQAYLDLLAGNKGESFAYTQGDGSKSVTYTRANIGNLSQAIAELQQLLGLIVLLRQSFSEFRVSVSHGNLCDP